jgi:hypothetical protein
VQVQKQACRGLRKIDRTDQADGRPPAAVISVADKRIVILAFKT